MMDKFPSWLHQKISKQRYTFKTASLLRQYGLNTVCEKSKCPNRQRCYSKKTAAFLILGNKCTRNCAFCDIAFCKKPKQPDVKEPMRIASLVKELNLSHVVITMVTRDDLIDQGATHLAKTIKAIRSSNPKTTVEVLTSDFSADMSLVDIVINAKPDIFAHNLETTRILTSQIRDKASYETSLSVLSYVKKTRKVSLLKSGIMVGIGETKTQVKQVLQDMAAAGCDIVTIGQYLQPAANKLVVKEFIHPNTFELYKDYGLSIGIKYVSSGPFVRSSYNAEEAIKKLLN